MGDPKMDFNLNNNNDNHTEMRSAKRSKTSASNTYSTSTIQNNRHVNNVNDHSEHCNTGSREVPRKIRVQQHQQPPPRRVSPISNPMMLMSTSSHVNVNYSQQQSNQQQQQPSHPVKQQHHHLKQQFNAQEGPGDVNLKKNLYKTEMCRQFARYGGCQYGNKCQFAHGNKDIQQSPKVNHPKRNTKMCLLYLNGHCRFGHRCDYLHAAEPNEVKTSGLISRDNVEELRTNVATKNMAKTIMMYAVIKGNMSTKVATAPAPPHMLGSARPIPPPLLASTPRFFSASDSSQADDGKEAHDSSGSGSKSPSSSISTTDTDENKSASAPLANENKNAVHPEQTREAT